MADTGHSACRGGTAACRREHEQNEFVAQSGQPVRCKRNSTESSILPTIDDARFSVPEVHVSTYANLLAEHNGKKLPDMNTLCGAVTVKADITVENCSAALVNSPPGTKAWCSAPEFNRLGSADVDETKDTGLEPS